MLKFKHKYAYLIQTSLTVTEIDVKYKDLGSTSANKTDLQLISAMFHAKEI